MADATDEAPIATGEIEARASRLLLWHVLEALQATRADLEDLALRYEKSLGTPCPHPAMERDHRVNERASELLVDMLRRKAAGKPMNDNVPA